MAKKKDKKAHGTLWKFRWFILLLAEIALILSVFKLTKYRRETAKSEKANEELAQAVTLVSPTPTAGATAGENSAAVSTDDGSEAVSIRTESGDASGKPETCPIAVDFKLLLSKNTDCVGWLYCEDTPINLGVMQADDNTYYLGHTFDRVPNGYGTIFLDCNCSSGFRDANNLIFGHDMQNGTMFGSLENYSSQEYFEAHRYLWLVTESRSYRLDVVAGMLHADDSSVYSTPISRRATDELVPYAIENSLFRSGASYNPEANYVTLSTCSDAFAGGRLAIICEMVEIRQ